MTSRNDHYTPQPYDPYGEDDDGGWFNSDGTPPPQQRYQEPYQQPQEPQQPYEPQQQSYAVAIPEQPRGDHDDQPTYALRTVQYQQVPDDEPAYRIPETPEAGWEMEASRRRAWVSRAVLLCILAVQAALSLRLSNTAFQDEALYLAAGHSELANLLHGTPLPRDYAAYFSGSPQLYPVLAAIVDSKFGLAGARTLSLFFMLCTTGLLYSFTRRLFSERAALAAAALYAVIQSTAVMGYFATYDACAVFLLALTTWIVVRTDRAPVITVLLAAPVAVLAVGVKYASALYLPTIVVLALLTAWPHKGGRAFLRMVLLGAGIGGLVVVGMHTTDLMDGVRQTTTDRAHGTDTTEFLLEQSARWGGLMFLAAVGGAVSYVRRSRLNESPQALRLSGPGWRWRALLGLVLCATALLAPAYQIHLGTVVSLFKHVGFGLLFAAPMAGVGVNRLMGAHFRYPQLGIMLWTAVLCLGIQQADRRFDIWPNSSKMIAAIQSHVDSKGTYLASTPEVPVYYLREKSTHRQWHSLFGMEYKDAKGKYYSGDQAYKEAVKDGDFDLIVLDGLTNPRVDDIVAAAVKGNAHYRLLAEIPFRNANGTSEYRIWLKTS
ncbi:ArnT family glycosyltransferase [Streptomyces sp. NPDC101175]|uniref:ArnT family glycosyltransferase n=1 Tax=Streptomyces sp. NPDC101175 TaxID=3366123 RepID=UPI0038368074